MGFRRIPLLGAHLVALSGDYLECDMKEDAHTFPLLPIPYSPMKPKAYCQIVQDPGDVTLTAHLSNHRD